MRCNVRDRSWIAVLMLASVTGPASAQPPPLAPDRLAALDRISSDSLKGHLSFLASDLLEGREAPSRGLDLAAEYIAAQFRRAGLEPVGDDGYFQTANWELSEVARDTFTFEVIDGDSTIKLGPDDVGVTDARSFHVDAASLYKVDSKTYTQINREDLAGKAILVELPMPTRRGNAQEQNAAGISLATFGTWARSAKVAAVVVIARDPTPMRGLANSVLYDPKAPETAAMLARREAPGLTPMITVKDAKLLKLFDDHPVGPVGAKLSTHLADMIKRPVKLRNVAGLLRGSDPDLNQTYVMVTAHYDHLGVRGPAGSDRIFNGANDDGSGTVSVIEIASALATLKERPKRSFLFVTFFGEEKGLLGSRYYGRNPLVPVDKTVADVNLEQVGRTDDSEGSRVGAAALTGFGYSDVSKALVAAGEAEGFKVTGHPRNSDAYFGRSDNQALADLGVPAHTLCVAFAFPDYHGAADHWDKVDYANMAKVDRTVARGLLTIADDPVEPKWDESNPRAARYRKAWKDRRGK
jgi:hypothetical protein